MGAHFHDNQRVVLCELCKRTTTSRIKNHDDIIIFCCIRDQKNEIMTSKIVKSSSPSSTTASASARSASSVNAAQQNPQQQQQQNQNVIHNNNNNKIQNQQQQQQQPIFTSTLAPSTIDNSTQDYSLSNAIQFEIVIFVYLMVQLFVQYYHIYRMVCSLSLVHFVVITQNSQKYEKYQQK